MNAVIAAAGAAGAAGAARTNVPVSAWRLHVVPGGTGDDYNHTCIAPSHLYRVYYNARARILLVDRGTAAVYRLCQLQCRPRAKPINRVCGSTPCVQNIYVVSRTYKKQKPRVSFGVTERIGRKCWWTDCPPLFVFKGLAGRVQIGCRVPFRLAVLWRKRFTCDYRRRTRENSTKKINKSKSEPKESSAVVRYSG